MLGTSASRARHPLGSDGLTSSCTGSCGDGASCMSMIAPTPPTSQPDPSASPAVYRFTVDEYERMVLDDPRVELIDGYVVRKIGKNPPQSWATKAVLKALVALLPPGWTWRLEQPVRIPEYDEPEPDAAIVRGSDDDYKHRTPGPADIGFLVEVSETTL